MNNSGVTSQKCYFCNGGITPIEVSPSVEYSCDICGFVSLAPACADLLTGDRKVQNNKSKLSIYFRQAHEKHQVIKYLTLGNLHEAIDSIPSLTVLDKMDRIMLYLDKETKSGGQVVRLHSVYDAPKVYCENQDELLYVLEQLSQRDYLKNTLSPRGVTEADIKNITALLVITAKGFEYLRELRKSGIDSRQCFVAMWLDEGLDKVYDVIENAVQEARDKDKYTALKITLKQHNEDINDHIIAEIKRSKFIIADLTGNGGARGGVYFEAGFAEGLGLKVIYTCKESYLPKVHFDLNHRNIIKWSDEKLGDFKEKLIQRIRATID
jgi:hypothetical protein